MLVEKVINNNIVSAFDETGKELVVMGRGLGFGVRPGQPVDEKKIEKVFRIKSRDTADQLKELLAGMPLERVKISTDIISFAKSNLNLKLNQSIYVTLTDHINFAIERFEKGINLQNALLWEIKRFYPHEFDLGSYALKLIKERLGVELPEDEAGFIALHFVNAEYGTNIKDAFRFPNQLRDILEITSDELGIVLDERTLHYERFVTHLKFFAQRLFQDKMLDGDDRELQNLIKTQYAESYACAEKIAKLIWNEHQIAVPEEELIYLAVYIRRITAASDEEE